MELKRGPCLHAAQCQVHIYWAGWAGLPSAGVDGVYVVDGCVCEYLKTG